MRAFIAISLPEEIQLALAGLQDRLKEAHADVKWVESRNIHLTLKFLGEIDDRQLVKIMEILEGVAGQRQYFPINIFSIGAYPKIDSPRVIWVGIDKGDGEIKELAKALEEKIAAEGIPKEVRPFSSHITIGRVRSGMNKNSLVQKLTIAEIPGGLGFAVRKIVLFKSTLTPKGPAYEILKETSLKAI